MNSSDYFSSLPLKKGLRRKVANAFSSRLLAAFEFILGIRSDHPRQLPPDCFDTPHLKLWFDTPEFQECYQNAIIIAGSDYRIPWRVHQLLFCLSVSHIIGKDHQAHIVEFGTGRGFMMGATVKWQELYDDTREVHLFDLFQRPDKTGQGNMKFASYYADSPENVMAKFKTYYHVNFHVGDIRETINCTDPKKISFVHCDLNNPRLEVHVIQQIWSRLLPGSIILLDDFANRGFESAFYLHTKFFRDKGLDVLTTPAGQGIVMVI